MIQVVLLIKFIIYKEGVELSASVAGLESGQSRLRIAYPPFFTDTVVLQSLNGVVAPS
jgi:hypothetical protein